MRLAVMQPYFFPYLGYFSLLAATDQWVVFDPVQYIRHGWINRNKILRPDRVSPQYIVVPLAKHRRETAIRDIRIASQIQWQNRIVGQLQHYRQRAPYFESTMQLVQRCLDTSTACLVDLNVHCLLAVFQHLDRKLKVVPFNSIESKLDKTQDAGDWALNISTILNAKTYVNLPGGRGLFDPDAFRVRGIGLEFIENRLAAYDQKSSEFLSGLSILDVLMFNGIEGTNKLIDDYTSDAV